jgi:hypothetical protein
MGCGGTKTDMSKKEFIEWVKKERALFEDEYNKEEKLQSEKMMQTLKNGMSNANDPLAEGLKAIGEMQKNIEFQLDQKKYLDMFIEIESLMLKSEYNNINVAQEIFNNFLKIKQSKEFKSVVVIMEQFRKYINENDKNKENNIVLIPNVYPDQVGQKPDIAT